MAEVMQFIFSPSVGVGLLQVEVGIATKPHSPLMKSNLHHSAVHAPHGLDSPCTDTAFMQPAPSLRQVHGPGDFPWLAGYATPTGRQR